MKAMHLFAPARLTRSDTQVSHFSYSHFALGVRNPQSGSEGAGSTIAMLPILVIFPLLPLVGFNRAPQSSAHAFDTPSLCRAQLKTP